MNEITGVSIFLPRKVLENLSCLYLFGYRVNEHSKVIISCTFSAEYHQQQKDILSLLQTLGAKKTDTICSSELQFVGIIYASKRRKKFSHMSEEVFNPLQFILRVDDTTDIFYVEKLYLNSTNQTISTHFILYDSLDLLNSSLLRSVFDMDGQNHFLPFLINSLTNKQKLCLPSNCYNKVTDFSFSSEKNYGFISLYHLFRLFETFFKYWDSHFVSFWFCQSLLNLTHVGRQLHQRILHCKEICLKSKTQDAFNLKCKNLIFAILFDIICGWLITFTILKSDLPALLLESTVEHTNNIVNGLQKLIYWLMGVPAGLKLNIPLNSALGHFFLYHIYLWEAYMTIVLPVFYLVLKISTLIGILGFTFSLCLLSDLISLATVHIYCFYGYAARLYGYQVSCLSALWRLFRGKKWNPLRQRVDSYSYDIHQLYLGTLIFTVLLFLLPTVLVYYFVFTCLRILVLIVQGVVLKITEIFSILPLYSLILRILKSSETAGGVYFTVFSSQSTLVLLMQVIQAPFSTVIKNTLPELHKYAGTLSWKDLLSSILSGDIIYPL